MGSGGGVEREDLVMTRNSSALAGGASTEVSLWEGVGRLSGRTSFSVTPISLASKHRGVDRVCADLSVVQGLCISAALV